METPSARETEDDIIHWILEIVTRWGTYYFRLCDDGMVFEMSNEPQDRVTCLRCIAGAK